MKIVYYVSLLFMTKIFCAHYADLAKPGKTDFELLDQDFPVGPENFEVGQSFNFGSDNYTAQAAAQPKAHAKSLQPVKASQELSGLHKTGGIPETFSKINDFDKSGAIKPDTQEKALYILRIDFPPQTDTIPPICGYYKGYKLEFDNELCILPESQMCDKFVLVITPQINHKSDGSNIKYLERSEKQPCRLFYLTGEYNAPTSTLTNWCIEEEKIKNVPLRLPDSALVLLMNPRHIDKVIYSKNRKNLNKKIEQKTFTMLPTIVIKKQITQKELNSASIYTLLASLDANAVHVPIKRAVKNERGIVISMRSFTH